MLSSGSDARGKRSKEKVKRRKEGVTRYETLYLTGHPFDKYSKIY
jgi:hypothetical protein